MDLKRLDVAERRDRLILPTLEDIAPKLLEATLDASSVFWQNPQLPETNHVYYTSTVILFPEITIWNHLFPRNLPEGNEHGVK